MTLPHITFKHTNIDSDESLQSLVEKKFHSLDRYVGTETDVKCDVEFEKTHGKQTSQTYRVEANFWLAGVMYRAEAKDESFEKAIDEVRSELDKEMRRAHKKRNSLLKRGGRKIKQMMRFGG